MLSLHLHRLQDDDNSCIHIDAIDSFPDHRLQLFLNKLFHQNRQPHIIAHLQQLNRPIFKMREIEINCPKPNDKFIEEHTPLRLDVIATIGLHVFVCGLYRSADDNSIQSSRPPTA